MERYSDKTQVSKKNLFVDKTRRLTEVLIKVYVEVVGRLITLEHLPVYQSNKQPLYKRSANLKKLKELIDSIRG